MVGEEPERRSSGAPENRIGSHLGGICSLFCLVGWGGQAQHFTGCVPFSWSEVLRRGCRGGSGRGRAYLGSGPSPSPTDSIFWPFFPRLGSCPRCSCFQPRWFHCGELTPSDGWEAKGAFSSRLFPSQWRGSTQRSKGAGGVIAPRHQCLLLISPPGILMTFLFLACATYLGRLAPMAPVTQARVWQGTLPLAAFLLPRRA